MDENISFLKKEILYWGKRLYQNGMSPSVSGNISVRYEDKILLTAAGVCLGDMDESDIVLSDKNLKILSKNSKKPTTEKVMHAEIYKTRNDINAVIHCHSPFITAFAVSGTELDKAILADFTLLFEKVPLVSYFCPSTIELANAVKNIFKKNNAALLKNHGVILGADNLKNAYYLAENLEAYAKTYIYAQILGKVKGLSKKSKEEIKKVYMKK